MNASATKIPFQVLLDEVRYANRTMAKFIRNNDTERAIMWANKVDELESKIKNY